MSSQEDLFLKLKQVPYSEALKVFRSNVVKGSLLGTQIALRDVGWKWEEFMNFREVKND